MLPTSKGKNHAFPARLPRSRFEVSQSVFWTGERSAMCISVCALFLLGHDKMSPPPTWHLGLCTFPLLDRKLEKSAKNRDCHWYWLAKAPEPYRGKCLTFSCQLMVQQRRNFPSLASDRSFWACPLSTVPSGPLKIELSQAYFWKHHCWLFLLGDCMAL